MSKRNKIIVGILLAVSILVAGNEIYQYVRGLTADYPDNDINGYITTIDTDKIDTDYMNTRFVKFLKLRNSLFLRLTPIPSISSSIDFVCAFARNLRW